jgi:hypothetical protein
MTQLFLDGPLPDAQRVVFISPQLNVVVTAVRSRRGFWYPERLTPMS